MIIDDKSDKLKQMRKDAWKFDFPFRTERIIHSPPLIGMRKDKRKPTENYQDNTDKGTVTTPSNPTTPTTTSSAKHDYSDPTVYYVSRDFFAATTDHLSVFIDDELELIEELPGGAWTRVKERDSRQVGLIPTEILESGAERLAKENKTSNQDSIRVLSCQPSSSDHPKRPSLQRKNKKTVSFSEQVPEIVHYPPDHTNDHSIFPFTLEDDDSQAIAFTEATSCDILGDDLANFSFDEEVQTSQTSETEKSSLLKRLFKKKSRDTPQVLDCLQDFEKYPDHLIRVYTGNFDSLLHGYKTFIVDESLTFDEFTQMVISTFDLDTDGFFYELNLVNHLTAEVVPLALDFTIEQVIELTKREGLAFSTKMPPPLRKAQKSALKRLKRAQQSSERDKSSDYVTPFKFVLNRIFSPSENVPIYVHVSLSYAMSDPSDATNLIISSLFPDEQDTSDKKTKKWYQKFKKNNPPPPSTRQSLHRLQVNSQDPLHMLIHHLLTSLNVPETLPGIAFEAFLPAIHDAIELPLPVNMPIGEVMKIRPKLDQSQQVIIIRPVIVW